MARRSLSHWGSIVEEANNGVKIWVGVDVHKSSYAVAVLSGNGVVHTYTTVSDNQALLEQFSSRGIKVTCLVYEAGLTGFGLARACQRQGVPVMVVSPNRIPRPATKSAKTDRIDCINLVGLLAKGMLKGIAIPTAEQEAKRALVRRRIQLTKALRVVKLRIKSFLVCHGLVEPVGLKYFSKSGVEELKTLPLLPPLRICLDSLLHELEFLQEQRKKLEAQIEQELIPAEDVLQSVPGVGPVISASFRAELFSCERFTNATEVASYLGLAPCIRQSGASAGTARLAPCGQGSLRGLLVEAAWILKRREKWAENFYARVRHRSGCFQKAISALARKLAVLLWRLLMENRAYQSNYNTA